MCSKVVNVRHSHSGKFLNGVQCDVYIGRPSIFGNPFRIGKDGNRQEVIDKFKDYFYLRVKQDAGFKKAVEELQGKVLGCHCKPLPCHGDIIVGYLDRETIARFWLHQIM